MTSGHAAGFLILTLTILLADRPKLSITDDLGMARDEKRCVVLISQDLVMSLIKIPKQFSLYLEFDVLSYPDFTLGLSQMFSDLLTKKK